MDLQIEYLEDEGIGRLSVSPDTSQSTWGRVTELILGIEPDASIGVREAVVDWTTVLSIAPGLASLRKTLDISISYDVPAKRALTVYRNEMLAIHAARGQFSVQLTVEEIRQRLRVAGMTLRSLTEQQERDVAKLVALQNGANFSVPGAGKTTVALAVHLLARAENAFLLVVAPKNAFGAWDEVIQDSMAPGVAQDWAFLRLTGGHDAIREKLEHPQRCMIIGYDQLIRVLDVVLRFMTSHHVHLVLDESHRMKAGDKSQRGLVLARLSYKAARRDILSGTPIPRSIADIAPQLDFLWPGQRLGSAVINSDKPAEVFRNLYVRTTKHELKLPPITREFLPVQMSSAQVALYGLIRQEVLKRLTGIKTNTNIDLYAAKRSVMRLLQVSSNPILVVRRLTNEEPENYTYDDPKLEAIFTEIASELDSPKILHACELARKLASQQHKSVIWTSFTENVERIATLLSDLGATFIHGGVDAGEVTDPATREGRIALFNDVTSDCKVLVANPAACSEGISLHRACHHAIYVDRTFNAAHYLQSVDRIHRLGLDPDVKTFIYVLESTVPQQIGAIDYSVRRRLIDKLHIMAKALEDFDLRQLALDEEEAEAPIDFDMTLEDIADVIRELEGNAAIPGVDEEIG